MRVVLAAVVVLTALAGRTTGRTYRLGDAIEVGVEHISRHEGKIELALPQ